MIDKINRDCAICRYKIDQQMPPPEIRRVMVCRRFPPTTVMVPMSGGHNQASAFPIVGEGLWCYEWAPDLAGSVTQVLSS